METYKIKTEIDTGNSVKDLATLRKELDELAQSGKEGTDEFKKLEEELQKLAFDSSEAGKVLNKFGGTLEQVVGEGVQPLSFAIGELEDRLYEMAAAGLQGTAEFNEMAQEVGRMKQVILETDMQLDGLSMTTTQKVGGSLQGLASGFETAQGVMGAFGVESEAVEGALLKVQSAMAISQGIQGVKEALPALKSLGSGAVNAFKGMTAAGKAFAVTGIGLVITALAVAAEVMSSFADETEQAEKAQEKLQVQLDNTNQVMRDSQELTNSLVQGYISETEVAVAQAKLRGASEEELLQVRKDSAAQQRKLLELDVQKQKQAYYDVVNNKKASLEDLTKAEELYFKASRSLDEYDTQSKLNNINQQLEAQQKLKDQQQKYADDRKAALEKIRQAEQDYHDTFISEQDLEILTINRKYDELVKEAKKFKIDTTEVEKARLNEINEINTKYAQEQLQIEQEKQDELDRIIKEANEQRLQDKEDFNEEYQQAINSDTQNEINAINEKYFYLIETAKQYGLDVTELERKKNEELAAINDQYRDDEKTKNAELQQAKYDAVQGGLQALLSLSEAFAGQSEEQQKRAFQFAKAVNIAQATIDTYRSAVTAFKSAPNPILGAVFSAIAIASGIANIKKIASTTFEGGSTPSAEGGAGGLGGVITPEFNIVGNSPINQLAELQGQPVQAYVVSGEVTTAQSLDRNRIINATL